MVRIWIIGSVLVLALNVPAAAQQRSIRAAFLQFAESGGDSLRDVLGLPGDPTSIARQIGFRSGAALGGFTPQDLAEIQAQIGIQRSAQVGLQGDAEHRGLLDAQRGLQHDLEQVAAGPDADVVERGRRDLRCVTISRYFAGAGLGVSSSSLLPGPPSPCDPP